VVLAQLSDAGLRRRAQCQGIAAAVRAPCPSVVGRAPVRGNGGQSTAQMPARVRASICPICAAGQGRPYR
jgi:NMD protein affecting ribosome stability and mRNA decay